MTAVPDVFTRFDDAPVPLWRSDAQGRRTAVNEAWQALAGRGESEELGDGWARFIHDHDRDRYVDAYRAAVRAQTGFEIEYRLRCSSGHELWLLDRAVPLLAGGAFLGHAASATDITELKQVEAELRQALKLDAIERLAGGVAHEFNNVLTTVIGFSDLVEATLAEADPRRDDLGEIRGAAERGAVLTQQLLALGRGHTLRPSIVDLNDVLADAMPAVHRLLGPAVEVQAELGSQRALVRVDRAQLEQALTSLALNARDAMPDGGTFTIRTADEQTSVVLVVSDTGVGMAPNVVAHLFEPFFTTKGQGAGTGLGLASVHGAVRQCGGRIDVDSAPGAGTRFTIVLPKASGPDGTGHGGGESDEGDDPPRCVLVVEDEPSVRRLAVQALTGHGYRVTGAASAEDALALVTADGVGIDVLVTDIVLPGISGLELAEQLVQLRSGLRVIYVSGYVDESALRLTAVEPSGFLAKPFTPGALLARVERALSTAQVR